MNLLDQVTQGFESIDADSALKQQALGHLHHWLTDPELAAYRPQVEWLIQKQDWLGLLDRFYQILPFGTGGRRGAVGIGPNRMNFWTLGASVQGHCEYLRERFPGVEPLKVVLAYDVRRFEDTRRLYNPDLPNPMLHVTSRQMAEHAACVYVANGIHASLLSPDSTRFMATPELSFAIRHLQAHGGLNISASHNPPDDNGGKFYDERGGQPVAPDDQIMADLVDQVKTIKVLPWSEAQRSGRLHWLDDRPHTAYIDLCCRQSLLARPRHGELTVVFTPLHGVGGMTALEVLQKQGFDVETVAEQMTPDGLFPIVTKSPNPEVPESMDRAAALAERVKADMVIATDPDADRVGCMVPAADGWQIVTGNEIATLLTYFKLAKLTEQGRLPASPIVVTTEVTCSLVTKIGRNFGAQVVGNLMVGFKYIAEVLWQLEQSGKYEDIQGSPDDFVIGTEESHGVMAMPQVRDKDAAAASLLLAELALDQKRLGRTVRGYLEAIQQQFGYYHNQVHNLVMTGIEGKQQMVRILDALRRNPPTAIGGLPVTGFEDLRDENGRFGPIRGATDYAARNFLIFKLGDNAKIALRPSGTEPKAKAYVEVGTSPRLPEMSDEEWNRTCRKAAEDCQDIGKTFVELALGLGR